MSTITITISEADNLAFVNRVVSRGDYISPDDYVNTLIARDRDCLRKQKLDQMLIEGLDSDALQGDQAFWDDMFRRFDQRHPANESSS